MSSTPRPAPAPATATHVLSARAITKSFTIGDRTLDILHGVDLDLARGELVSLMGASGAGKSTFLHILGLLESPTAGEVFIEGHSAWKLPVQERASVRNQKLGFVFQFYHLLSELDAVENVLLPAMILHGRGAYLGKQKALRERARALLVKFGLEHRLEHRPSQLSGGERQRVALARALFLDPPIVIADEPTGNLDSATGEKVLELLLAEQRERNLTLLLVTHDERIARRCQRVVRMADGRVHSDGDERAKE
ncbi:MAG: ABC transporter ATP-binding protein [Planctomycetes bacterium]|nr:ABC transporter ATP-binding protein [Planctomycetota bacterium]